MRCDRVRPGDDERRHRGARTEPAARRGSALRETPMSVDLNRTCRTAGFSLRSGWWPGTKIGPRTSQQQCERF